MARTERAGVIALLALGLGLCAAPARADVAPPSGVKYVGYAFTVDNLEAFADFAMVAYPCSGSSGVPMAELVELAPGRDVAVGRRGGSCKLYGLPKAELAAWRKANPDPGRGTTNPAADALVAKAKACSGGPTPVLSLPSSDPRKIVTETLRVTKLDAEGCTVVASTSAAAGGAAQGPAAPPPEPPPKPRGCGGCAVPDREQAPAPWALVAGLAALVWRRGRRTR
jgi:hypothetical protein